MPTYYEDKEGNAVALDMKRAGKGIGANVAKVLVLYLLKQLSHDTWIVSGDAELESKSRGFRVYIPVQITDDFCNCEMIVGVLLKKGDDGSLEMAFCSVTGNGHIPNMEIDIKKTLQSIASMPLPPYIEPGNAIKVCHYAVTPLSNSVPLNASFKTNLPPRVKSLSYSILKTKGSRSILSNGIRSRGRIRYVMVFSFFCLDAF